MSGVDSLILLTIANHADNDVMIWPFLGMQTRQHMMFYLNTGRQKKCCNYCLVII